MTPLNTIIEEEEKFDVVDWLRNTYGLDDDDCLSAGRVQELCEMLVFDVRTTAMQRAYESGRRSTVEEIGRKIPNKYETTDHASRRANLILNQVQSILKDISKDV